MCICILKTKRICGTAVMKNILDMLKEIEKKYGVVIAGGLHYEDGEKVPFYSVVKYPCLLPWDVIIFGNIGGWRKNNNKELRKILESCEQRKVFVTRIINAISPLASLSVCFEWLRIENEKYVAKISIGWLSTRGIMKTLVSMGYATESVCQDTPFFRDYYLQMPVDSFEEIMGLLGG